MMHYVTFYGGFHNCGAIRVRVNDEQYNALKEGLCPKSEVLSDYQVRRLQKHFCGVDGCLCGGFIRATMDL